MSNNNKVLDQPLPAGSLYSPLYSNVCTNTCTFEAPRDIVKKQILIPWVWGETSDSQFLTSFLVMWILLGHRHTKKQISRSVVLKWESLVPCENYLGSLKNCWCLQPFLWVGNSSTPPPTRTGELYSSSAFLTSVSWHQESTTCLQ